MKKIENIERKVFVLLAVLMLFIVVVVVIFYPWVSWKQALIVSVATIVSAGVCTYIGYRIGSKIMK